jgi:rare lipoprotein A (peptidoglycan hydrolase)
VRRLRVVAGVALTAVLAMVAVPGPVGSQGQSLIEPTSSLVFTNVKVDAPVQGTVTTIEPPDPGARSDGNLDQGSTLFEPALASEPPQARVSATQPKPDRGSVSKNPWRRDPEISWYGPGLIGNGTACGQTLTRSLVGVAHRSLPCGTLVTFRANGHTLTMPVVDRGPFVSGRIFDLTYGACKKLEHCYTGPIDWRYGSR